jgi:hypothetical protein
MQQSRIGTLERQVMELQRVVDEWQQAYKGLHQQFVEATGREPMSSEVGSTRLCLIAVQAWQRPGLVGIAVEAVREDQQRGRPQADENAEALGVRLFLGRSHR